MVIRDRIYGEHQITSPVLIALINSHPLQRLKGIGQAGQPKKTDPQPYRFSRYSHSIGVMLLLKHLGAAEEEQIAGLLHDVSHTAFSHTIDFVLERGKNEDFQDSQHQKFILNSEIPSTLESFRYNVKRIYDYHNFTLLEQSLPALCADRVDYSLRESPKALTAFCLPSLIAYQGKIVFTDQQKAKTFAERFLKLQKNCWGGEDHVIRERIFAEGLKYALKKHYITLDDFWQTDAFILSKLQRNRDAFITHIFALLERDSFTDLPKSNRVVQKKFRFVDPEIVINKRLYRLSELDKEFRLRLKKEKTSNEQGITLPAVTDTES